MVQEKANADPEEAAVLQQQQIQFCSLKEALQVDWSTFHPRRSHKLLRILAGTSQGCFASLLDCCRFSCLLEVATSVWPS